MNKIKSRKEFDFIVKSGEGYTAEFKENINSDLAKEMVAFANASGGRIFVGINDKKEITGITVSNSLLSQIQDVATNCDPAVTIEFEQFDKILIIHVKEGVNKPHRCNKGFYIRNGANSQKMTTSEITAFIQTEGKVRFDEVLRDDIDVNKVLDPKLLNRYLQLSQITKTLDDYSTLENLGVLSFKNKIPFLNNAGLLFFSNTVSPHLFFATITCALYKGKQKVTVLDRKDFSADIISNIEDTMVFLKKHLNLRYEIKTLRRKEILEIPEVALREAVINAACHRDYYEKGANIMVEIFDDRVQITNPGGLPKGLTKEKFGTLSVSRNPIISSLFHRANYIEKMGTGIYRIREALKEAGNPEPEFDCDQFFTLIFKREMEETTGKTTVETTVETTVKTTVKTGDMIVEKIKENPSLSLAEIAEMINKSLRAVERASLKLVKEGKIKHVGSKKGGHWEVINGD